MTCGCDFSWFTLNFGIFTASDWKTSKETEYFKSVEKKCFTQKEFKKKCVDFFYWKLSQSTYIIKL